MAERPLARISALAEEGRLEVMAKHSSGMVVPCRSSAVVPALLDTVSAVPASEES